MSHPICINRVLIITHPDNDWDNIPQNPPHSSISRHAADTYMYHAYVPLPPRHPRLFLSVSSAIDWPRVINDINSYLSFHLCSLSPPSFSCAVEITDCWARGKRDSINLRLSLTVTFTWQSCTVLPEMQFLPAKALAYAPEIRFLSLY